MHSAMYPAPSSWGHEHDEAVEPWVFGERFDVDRCLERLSDLDGPPRRRPGGGAARWPALSRADDRKTDKPPKVDLVLYTSAASDKSQRAVRAIRAVLERYDASQIRFSTCDLSTRPQDGEADAVMFTPTLVKQGPGPRTSIIGNLEHEEILCDLLDASGVDRRRDG